MSSGVIYPVPTYIPPLPIFNPLFFPQTFATTTTSGGGGGFTNIFPNGLTSGNVITMNGGTGGGGGTGAERTITGLSQIEWADFTSTNPTAITGYMKLNSGVLEIGSGTASSGINVNLLGSVISANGVAIATGGNVSNDINNTFQAPATIQTFDTQNVVMDNSTLSFPNGGGITTYGGSANLSFPTTFPTTSTGAIGGLGIYWNNISGNGETDLICYGQFAGGSNISGLNIYNCNNTTAPILVASFNASSSTIISNPTIPTSTTIGTLTASQTATTFWVNSNYVPKALTYISQSATAIAGGFQWIFQIPAQSANSPYASPPWGKTFSYVVYSNPNLSTASIATTGIITQSGTFGSITGTGVYQPIINSGDGLAYYAYQLSPFINSMGTTPLTYLQTQNQNGAFWIYFTTTTTIFGTSTLTLDIRPNP